MKRTSVCWILLYLTLLLSGCAETGTLKPNEIDPYETINRHIYNFNTSVDDYIAAPLSEAYIWITPNLMQRGINNFFNNLKEINVVLNDFLQGKFEQAAEDGGRLVVNSTLGMAGLFDIAADAGLERHEEDFDQTLAVWGIPQGPYFVLPLLGPTTGRGIPGGVLDTATNPSTYISVLPIRALEAIDLRAKAKPLLEMIKESAIDPYVFTREAFLQHRHYLISDEKSSIDPDFDLEEDLSSPQELNPKTSASKK